MSLITKFLKNESGATAIEYGLIAALIAVVLIATLGDVGTSLKGNFEDIKTGLDNAGDGGGAR